MLKPIFTVFFALLLALPQASLALTEEQDEKCDKELAEAKENLEDKIRDLNTAQITATQDPRQQQQQQSPFTQMMQQVAQCPVKMAEVDAKTAEKLSEVSTQWEEQDVKIDDTIHDMKTQPYRQKMELIKVQQEKYVADRALEDACKEEAIVRYNAYKGGVDAGTRATTNAQSSLGSLSGSNARVRAKKKEYEDDCIARKQGNFSDNVVALNRQAESMRQQTMINLSDLAYQQSKKDRLANFAANQATRAEQTGNMQKNAVMQSCVASLVGAGMSMDMSTAQVASDERVAGQATSARETLVDFTNLKVACANDQDDKVYKVPADIYPIFSQVNRYCRPDATTGCVSNSGQTSAERRAASSVISP